MRYQLHFDGYEIFNQIQVGQQDIMIGMKDVYGDEPFIVITSHNDEDDYQVELTCDSFVEAMTLYCASVLEALDELKAHYEILEIPETPLTADNCLEPDTELTGKLCVVEADAFSPDKRTADYQLFCIVGKLDLDGDQCETTYLARCLRDGKLSFIKECQILGEADAGALPLWVVKEYAGLSQQIKKFDPEIDVISQDAKFYNRAVHIFMGKDDDFVEEIM